MNIVRRDQLNRTQKSDHAGRECESFVYSIKITRFSDCQTWPEWRNARGAQRFMDFCFLDCAFQVLIWLGRRTTIIWNIRLNYMHRRGLGIEGFHEGHVGGLKQ